MLSTACIVLALAFVALALFVDGSIRLIGFAIAAAFAAAAGWNFFQARRSAVLIDANQFIVKDGGKQRRFDISHIESVDLSRLGGHVRFKDGTSVTLPLEGDELMEAGLLLHPPGSEI